LTHLLADGDLRRKLSAAGRRKVQQYDWSMVTDQILDCYRETIDRNDALIRLSSAGMRGARTTAKPIAEHLVQP